MASLPPEDRAYGGALGGARRASLDGALGAVVTDLLRHHPDRLPKAVSDLAIRQGRTGVDATLRLLGRGGSEPLAPGDHRFSDRAWQENPFLRAIAESYLATAAWAGELVEAASAPDMVRRQARFSLRMALDAAAPTNVPWANPAVVKEAYETGGRSLVAGFGNFLDDLAHNGGRPRQVDSSSFEVGRNMAATPGRVVFRNQLIELLAYEPQTELVHAQPILCSPPWINKFYIMDLAPQRSFVEYAVQHGFTVFMISYRNPDESMAETTWDDYLRLGLLAAIEQVQRLTGSDVVNVVGLCLGGTMATIGLGYLAAKGQGDRVGWMTVTNTMVDFSIPGDLGVFTDEAGIAKLEKAMRKRGFLPGSSLAQTFDWLRGNDLVWNYVVSNWFMGKKPPAFDLLAWNGDSTNMPATMHSQYLRACYLRNQLVDAEAFTIAGTPIDLGRIRQPLYVLGAEADHIAPWRGTYLTTQRVGGEARYTLSSSGHIAGIVNPPGNAKAGYWTAPARHGLSADDWLAGAERIKGSWWDHWVAWAAERSGPMVAPPLLPKGDPAPGGYVRGDLAAPFIAEAAHPRAHAATRLRRAGHLSPNGRPAVRRKARSTSGAARTPLPTTPAGDATDTVKPNRNNGRVRKHAKENRDG
jgi:polyhydroxyalkanoate synthase subunit PhaC